MALLTQAPKGTQDLLPRQAAGWQKVEAVLRAQAELRGFGELRTPVFEHTELFQRSVGETTDVVQKEMYTFTDKGGRSVTLRPEGTAGAVRALLEDKIRLMDFEPYEVSTELTDAPAIDIDKIAEAVIGDPVSATVSKEDGKTIIPEKTGVQFDVEEARSIILPFVCSAKILMG